MSSESEVRSTASGLYRDAVGHTPGTSETHIRVCNLTMAYGDFVVQRNVNFAVKRRSIFIVMGGTGCGKSTLLRHMLGLDEPAEGEIYYGTENFTAADPEERQRMLRQFGVLYQSGALWSSMTLIENVSLPLAQLTSLSASEIREVAALKLALVGLKGFEDLYPAELSGGMQKRAGVARAIALDPEVLFFDEPSAGLDPVASSLLDDLILELRSNLGTTVIVVTHELASVFAIGDDSIFLDGESHTVIAKGNPKELLAHCQDPRVRRFLTRGHLAPA